MPRVIVCDVNETLLDVRALEPHFKQAFGDGRLLQDWFSTRPLLRGARSSFSCRRRRDRGAPLGPPFRQGRAIRITARPRSGGQPGGGVPGTVAKGHEELERDPGRSQRSPELIRQSPPSQWQAHHRQNDQRGKTSLEETTMRMFDVQGIEIHAPRGRVFEFLRNPGNLREAGLAMATGIGREQRYRLSLARLARVHHDWFAQFDDLWGASLAALKGRTESGAARNRRKRITSENVKKRRA